MNPQDIANDAIAILRERGHKPELSPQAIAVIHALADAVSARLREMKSSKMKIPTIEEVILQGTKIGLPKEECEAFVNFYCSKGWRVGNQPMKSWHSAMANWKKGFDERRYTQSTRTAHTTTVSPADKLLREFR